MSDEMNMLQPSPLGDGGTIVQDQFLAIAERAEQRARALQIIRATALKLTNQNDWELLGDKPYLNIGGAKKVSTFLGVSWQLDEPKYELHDDGTGHYTYTVEGIFQLGGHMIEEIGTRSSNDDFFKMAKGTERMVLEINRNNVRKAAVTNCICRGVKAVTGLVNVTKEELEQTLKEKVSAVASVRYDEKKMPFGEYKDQPLSQVPPAELKKIAGILKKNLTNPKNAKYKKLNQELIEAIEKQVLKVEQEVQAQQEPEPQEDDTPNGPDNTWLDFLVYMEDDPDRSAIMKQVKEKMHIDDISALTSADQSAFMNTCYDALKPARKR